MRDSSGNLLVIIFQFCDASDIEITHFTLKLSVNESSIKSLEQRMTQIQRETSDILLTLSSKSNWLLLKVVLEVAVGIK